MISKHKVTTAAEVCVCIRNCTPQLGWLLKTLGNGETPTIQQFAAAQKAIKKLDDFASDVEQRAKNVDAELSANASSDVILDGAIRRLTDINNSYSPMVYGSPADFDYDQYHNDLEILVTAISHDRLSTSGRDTE